MKSIVIPAFNEEDNIERAVKATLELGDIEVIISNDGSNDKTLEVARELAKLENVLLASGEHKGKGAAIKRGLEIANGSVLGFLDADMSAHPKALLRLFREIENGADVAIGSRDLPESIIPVKQPAYRRFMGYVYRNFTRRLFKIDIMDFQCGLKVFKREVWEDINVKTNGFTFDTELIARAHKKGYAIKEVPITWQNFKRSKVNPIIDPFKMAVELLKIRSSL
jgi:glycosyltransferase involved in cell wall biosynthesis